MTLRMPEEGKAGFRLKKLRLSCDHSKTRMMESLMKLPDDSIISVSIHCTRLQSLYLGRSDKITDASIISITTYCIGLQELNLAILQMLVSYHYRFKHHTNIYLLYWTTIIKSTGLLSVNRCEYQFNIYSLYWTTNRLQITDYCCDQITDASI